jgi:ABC-2 type transport system permease protein
VWGNMGFWGSIFIIFMAMLVIILVTNEFTYRTHRQNVIDGWSRMQFYHAKVWLVVALSAGATLYMFLTGVIFGLTHYGDLGDMFEKGEQIFYFFLLSLNYLGFALVISIWIKRSGLAIGVFMLYNLIIENMLRGLINWSTETKYGDFLPLQSSDELLPFPMMSMAQQMLKQEVLPQWQYMLVSMVWCTLYYLYGRDMIQHRDQ